MNEAKGMKSKVSIENVPAFLIMITKKNRPMKVRIGKGTEFAGKFLQN